MMPKATRRKWVISLLPLLAAAIFMQTRIDPLVPQFHSGENQNAIFNLSAEFILGPLLGLRQAVAGLLWVRADEFFDNGDYDAILPIIRMVTWLDPHNVDVYITGAWHMSYNFTDSQERSDRRYIPAAQKLLEEGVENNPNIYDIKFELGWENYDKIKNYKIAEYWFKRAWASEDPNDADKKPPQYVLHMLAHAQEHEAKITDCIATWRYALARSLVLCKQKPKDFSRTNMRDTEIHNLRLTLERRFSRYVHMVNFKVDKWATKSVNPVTGAPIPDFAYINPKTGKPNPPAITPPWNCGFDAHLAFPEPKVMEVSGFFNVGDGARVDVLLCDDNFTLPVLKHFSFNINYRQTIMMDSIAVIHEQFDRRIDMSKDPKMYSFSRPYYIVRLTFNPRRTFPYLQDRFGWSGEGLIDKHYLYINPYQPHKPVQTIEKVFYISRAQVMGLQPITNANVLPNDSPLVKKVNTLWMPY